MARSLSDISALSNDTNLYSVRVELCSLLLCGAGSLLASTSEAHWRASPNSCMSHCLIITPLEGVMIFNHIQMSTSDRLSDPSSSCQMAVGTPSGLCCHACSIDCILLGVFSLILKHGGFFDWLVGLTQLSHDCVHIPRAPCGSNFFHDLNRFFKEQIGHGAEIEPLCLSKAGSTEWTGQLPGL